MHRRPLTQLAQQRLAALLRPGDLAIDATAGNGHDTVFLAQQVGPAGHVHAFDIQQSALDACAARLKQAGVADRVQLHLAGHQQMLAWVPQDWIGRVSAVTFNFGYLPGGDKTLVTLPATTLAALAQARQLLRPGGCLSLMVYRGHPGGQEEADAVARWLAATPGLILERIKSPGPWLYSACRST